MSSSLCRNCKRPYPTDSIPYQCPHCTGIYEIAGPLPYRTAGLEPDQPGIWKYRHTFHLPENAPVVSLGEGDTPLIWSEAFGRDVAFKLEYLNPTGSFKDRGTAPMVSYLAGRGVDHAVRPRRVAAHHFRSPTKRHVRWQRLCEQSLQHPRPWAGGRRIRRAAR